MCGIIGSANFTPQVRAMLPFLALQCEDRGMDSWGASDGYDIIKNVGPISQSWYQERERLEGWEAGIFHTRGASVGRKDKLENAHPFEATYPDGRRLIGIHNGGVSNHFEINQRYKRDCEVDSMHLWHHRAEGLPWTEFRGYANVAFWESDPVAEGEEPGPMELKVARVGSNSLAVARVADGGVVFASELSYIRTAAAMNGSRVDLIYHLDENFVYRLKPNGEVWRTQEQVPFGHHVVIAGTGSQRGPFPGPVTPPYVYPRDHNCSLPLLPAAGGANSKTDAGFCFMCPNRLDKEVHLLCVECFARILKEFEADQAAGEMKKTPLIVQATGGFIPTSESMGDEDPCWDGAEIGVY